METCRHTKNSTQSSKLGVSCRSLYASQNDEDALMLGKKNRRGYFKLILNTQVLFPSGSFSINIRDITYDKLDTELIGILSMNPFYFN